MVFSSGAGQALGFCLMLLISRLFGPEKLGVFNYIYSFASLLAILLSLRFETTFTLETNENKLGMLVRSVFILSTAMSLVAFFVIKVLTIIGALKVGSLLVRYDFAICIISLTLAFINIMQLYYIREKVYQAMAMQSFFSPMIVLLFQSVLSLSSNAVFILILGAVVGRISLFIICVFIFKMAPLANGWSLGGLKHLKKYSGYSLSVCLSYFVNSSLVTLIPIISMHLFGSKQTGLISLAYRLVLAPAMIVSQSFAQVFYADFSEAYRHHEDNLFEYIKKTVLILFGIGVLGFVLAYFLAPLILFVIGKQWSGMIYYFRLMLPAFLLQFCIGPIRNGLNVIGKEKLLLFLGVVSLAFFLLGVVIVKWLLLSVGVYILMINIAISCYYLSILVSLSYYTLKMRGVISGKV